MDDSYTADVAVCYVIVDRSDWCSSEKDCCWLRLTFPQPVWKSTSESMLGRVYGDLFK